MEEENKMVQEVTDSLQSMNTYDTNDFEEQLKTSDRQKGNNVFLLN